MALLLVFLFKFLVFCFAIGIFVSVIGAIFAFIGSIFAVIVKIFSSLPFGTTTVAKKTNELYKKNFRIFIFNTQLSYPPPLPH